MEIKTWIDNHVIRLPLNANPVDTKGLIAYFDWNFAYFDVNPAYFGWDLAYFDLARVGSSRLELARAR